MLLVPALCAPRLPSAFTSMAAARRAAAALAAGVLTVLVPPAQAGRPLATDDADVLAPRACEWESLAARLRDRQPPLGTAWQTQLSCGVVHDLQLAASFSSSPEARRRRSEVAGLGTKLRLIGSDDETQPRLAASFAVNVLRLNDAAFEVRDNSLNLAASQRFAASWTGHLNLGWTHSRPAHASSLTWNAALEHALAPAVDAMAEAFGDDRGQPWINAGLRWSLTPDVSVNASFGVRSGGTSTRLATLGFKLAF